ncbi:MAG TPA: DegT/DnrJ/EryC1/StrS family aminotransferase [bacterium]|nr:DegT/DnrJ/EryC1/StrS family aminotransferase [bacterium]
MPLWKIPLFELELTDDDVIAVLRPLRNRWLTMGEETQRFESAFKEKTGARHAFAVSSGTAALHLALLALEIGPGDEVLLPSFTFVACANVIRAVGADPVFVDIAGETDWTISPEDLEAKITPRSRAVMVVHYAGFPCHMEAILATARRHNLAVIEDCAHALISKQDGITCGCFGDAGCFSFFSNKNMTTGEGGMITTQQDALAERLRLLRSHGMTSLTLDRYQGRANSYDVHTIGLNYRIDEIRSALGRSQLERLTRNLEIRNEIYQTYVEYLAPLDEITIPFLDRLEDVTGYHIFPIALMEGINRNQFIHALKEEGIQTSIHYPPIHRFQVYQEYLDGEDCQCPITESISARQVTLPFYPGMNAKDIQTVCEAVIRHARL